MCAENEQNKNNTIVIRLNIIYIFFLNRQYRHPCKYGSTTFTLPSIKSRKNDFGSYLGNISNPVSFHVSWKVIIIFPNNADLELMTTLIVLSWWIASVFKNMSIILWWSALCWGNAAITD